MSTEHEHAWVDGHEWGHFRQASEEVKSFALTDPGRGETLDSLKWRHWVVAYCVRHAIEHSESRDVLAIECGVEDGLTASFALTELAASRSIDAISAFEMLLFDAWGAMREQDLGPGEMSHAGKYSDLDLERTKHNLSQWIGDLSFFPGYLPGTLDEVRLPNRDLVYIHIDLNAARPTLEVCERLWPQLKRGGVILFDDYGWRAYHETKEVVDRFLSDKPGSLLKLPTGQAIYFR
jgi:hypothetical protein